MENLVIVFIYQRDYFQSLKFENEFDTVQKFYRHDLSTVERTFSESYPKDEVNIADRTQESNRLRLEGNKLVTAKNEKSNLLAACRLYTEAIFAAPIGSEALGLAHANRAFALLEFNYIQQAYDDCVCAREQGYPKHLMDKILLRQADCARKLRDVILLKRHLNELNAIPLNDAFMKKVGELNKSLEELLIQKQAEKTNDEVEMPLNRESQKIVKSSGRNGRYTMIASKAIKEGELIFREQSFCFAYGKEKSVCHECAATQIIPFPCMLCGKVVYCSLKCRSAHAANHAFECEAYQRKILENLTVEIFLAFRMVLSGLPQVVPLLRQMGSAKDLWTKLVDGDSSIAQTKDLVYARSLRVPTTTECTSFAILTLEVTISLIFSIYLKKYTPFFNFVKDTAASLTDWQIVTGALILRHLRQRSAIERYPTLTLNAAPNFALFENDIWVRPFCVQRGRLHNFSSSNILFLANVPYMGLANHSCVPSMRSRFSGRNLSTFAVKNIEPGEEISKCFVVHHKGLLFSERCEFLKDHLNFVCKCIKCKGPNPNEDFAEFHRYRCERSECRRIFIQLPKVSTNPWHNPTVEGSTETVKCSICGAVQTCKWFKEFIFHLTRAHEPLARNCLFRSFDNLNNWLLDYNAVKLFLANQFIVTCLGAHSAGFILTNSEFGMLVGIAKFFMKGISYRRVYNPVYYGSKLTFLWDIIALGKYKCSTDEMQDMLKDIEMIPDEFQVIFMNYYNDYIKPLISV